MQALFLQSLCDESSVNQAQDAYLPSRLAERTKTDWQTAGRQCQVSWKETRGRGLAGSVGRSISRKVGTIP